MLIWTLRAIDFWKDWYSRNNVKALVLSHGIYRFGIVAKIAMVCKVDVFQINIRQISKLTLDLQRLFPDYREFPSVFRELSVGDQMENKKFAKRQLDRRFSAEVGIDMPYSAKSSFSKTELPRRVIAENGRHVVIICAHSFFDNPHWNNKPAPFADYWDWICFMGELKDQTDYDWYIKTHPDPLPGEVEVLEQLAAKYTHLKMLPREVSWHQLIREGINTVITVNGSVGHELPLMGINVVNAGYGPRVAYQFNRNCSDKEDFKNVLLNLTTLKIPVSNDDIYEFYYINHYLENAENLIVSSYRKIIGDLGVYVQDQPVVYEHFLKHFDVKIHWNSLKRVQAFVDSNQHYYYEHRYASIHGNEQDFNHACQK